MKIKFEIYAQRKPGENLEKAYHVSWKTFDNTVAAVADDCTYEQDYSYMIRKETVYIDEPDNVLATSEPLYKVQRDDKSLNRDNGKWLIIPMMKNPDLNDIITIANHFNGRRIHFEIVGKEVLDI